MFSPETKKYIIYCSLVIGAVVLIALLSKWSQNAHQYSKPFIQKVKLLIEQSTRWNSLAKQDSNPIIQLIHCNFALVYAQVARNLVSNEDVEAITGIDINELCHYLEDCQAFAIQNIGSQAPMFKIDSHYSAGSGWV